MYCICTLPRGGMYFAMHPLYQEILSLGQYFPVHYQGSRECIGQKKNALLVFFCSSSLTLCTCDACYTCLPAFLIYLLKLLDLFTCFVCCTYTTNRSSLYQTKETLYCLHPLEVMILIDCMTIHL